MDNNEDKEKEFEPVDRPCFGCSHAEEPIQDYPCNKCASGEENNFTADTKIKREVNNEK